MEHKRQEHSDKSIEEGQGCRVLATNHQGEGEELEDHHGLGQVG